MALTTNQESALDLVATGLTVYEAAEQLGHARNTAWRWTKDAEFMARVEELYASRREEASQHFMAPLPGVVKNLVRLAMSAEDERVQLQAIKLYLDHAYQLAPALEGDMAEYSDEELAEFVREAVTEPA